MPVIVQSTYRAPKLFSNGHLQTIYPTLLRRVEGVEYVRRRIETPDGDFIDVDYSTAGANRCAVLAHGLEGCSRRSYVLGMVRALNRRGWDAAVWNFRGCSGEPNRTLRFYHSGDSDDLSTVVEHVLESTRYDDIALVGFSMGGNVILKYLGERGDEAHQAIRGAVTFSVPCDLAAGAFNMARLSNAVYMQRFLRMLRVKVRAKMELFPGLIDDEGFGAIRTFKHFDERYTAPLHGFRSAEDYWRKASSRPLLHRIARPTVLINALNDPFLHPDCYPYEAARENPFFFLEAPASGGHVGFLSFGPDGEYWSEKRAGELLEQFARREARQA